VVRSHRYGRVSTEARIATTTGSWTVATIEESGFRDDALGDTLPRSANILSGGGRHGHGAERTSKCLLSRLGAHGSISRVKGAPTLVNVKCFQWLCGVATPSYFRVVFLVKCLLNVN